MANQTGLKGPCLAFQHLHTLSGTRTQDWRYVPGNRGFDTAFGYLTGAEDYYEHTNGKSCKGLDLATGSPDDVNATHHFEAEPGFNGTYSTYMYQEHIHAILMAHPAGSPLFAYLPFQSVHEPIQAPDKFVNLYPPSYANGSSGRRTFAGMVSALDDVVGNVTATLRATVRSPPPRYRLRPNPGTGVFSGPGFHSFNILLQIVLGLLSVFLG